jgi:hypothetical protein
MLNTGADVRINGVDYFLAEEVENHYAHAYESMLIPRLDVTGAPGKQQLRPDRLLWTFDDWSGGEGNAVYYSSEPTRYNYSSGGINPRIRGQLMARPTRTVTLVNSNSAGTFTPESDIRERPTKLITAAGALWMGTRPRSGAANIAQVMYTTNGTTWTVETELDIFGSGTTAFAASMAGDINSLFIATVTPSTGTTVLERIDRNLSTGVNTLVTLNGNFTNFPIIGMALMNGLLYVWNGRKLYQVNVYSGSVPLAAGDTQLLFDTGTEVGLTQTWGTYWWGDLVATENSVIFFVSTDMFGRIYEFKKDIPTPIWTAPQGFTIKAIEAHSGVLWIAGHWGPDATPAHGATYAINLDTRRPVPAFDVRKQTNETLRLESIAGSYDNQLLVSASRKGKLFVYDGTDDALELLDDLTTSGGGSVTFTVDNHRVVGCATFGLYRIFAVGQPGDADGIGNWQFVAYATDTDANIETNFTGSNFISGAWDYDFPHSLKVLNGFYVTFKPLVANQQILVRYGIDDGALATQQTITSATAGNAQGRVFVPVSDDSSTVKFYKMVMEVRLESNSAGVKPPILNAITAEAQVIEYAESWTLALRIADEPNRKRPSNDRRTARELRDNILTAVETKSVVAFLDGFRDNGVGSVAPSNARDYDVVISDPIDLIDQSGQGVMRVTLRKVATT